MSVQLVKKQTNIFQRFHEEVCAGANTLGDPDYGTPQHMERTHSQIQSASVFQLKGTRVKLSRWWSLWDSLEQFLPHWSVYSMILCYICLRKGVVKKLSDLPVMQADVTYFKEAAVPEDASAVVPHAAPDDANAPRPEVRRSNDSVTKLRPKSKHTLHLACIVLASPLKRKVAAGLLHLVRPTRQRFGEMVVALGSQLGAVKWWPCEAAGTDAEQELLSLVQTLRTSFVVVRHVASCHLKGARTMKTLTCSRTTHSLRPCTERF